MMDLELLAILISAGVMVVETAVLFLLFWHIRKIEEHTHKLDAHITKLDAHIEKLDSGIKCTDKQLSKMDKHTDLLNAHIAQLCGVSRGKDRGRSKRRMGK